MRLIPLNEITIAPDRQRQEFDEDYISELMEDIAQRGLMHAVVIRQDGATPVLVAGECRIRAMRNLHEFAIPFRYNDRPVPLDQIPTVTLGNLSPLDALDAELSENIKRRDLTWQERAKAEAQLHALRQEQAAIKGEQQTLKATASELLHKKAAGSQVAALRESILLSHHLDDPEVAKAATPREALKVVEKKLIRSHNEKLAEEVGRVAPHERHRLIQGDAIEELKKLPLATFDAICSDPPYGIGADEFGSQADNPHDYDDSHEAWQKLMQSIAQLSFALAKPQAHAYLFCDFIRFAELSDFMHSAGWTPWPRPLIWAKSTGMLPRPEHGPRRTYECILFANKGDRKTTAVFGDVLSIPSEHTTLHPAQKPVGVFHNLLSRSCRPGDLVLDPFAGSGTIFPACNRLSLRAVGVEAAANYYGIALKRLEEK